MAVPKIRKSKSKTMIRRRSQDKRTLPSPNACPNCGAFKLPHHVCPECGSYKGKTVVREKKK